MGGIIERLRSLFDGGSDRAGTSDARAAADDARALAEERAIEAVEANRDADRDRAYVRLSDTPGSVDGD